MHQGACEQEQARLTATAYSCLPEQIYRLLAQCKDYQRELCGPALALSRFIDLLLFQIQNVHSSSKQDILGLWVPSIERWRSVLSITWADNWRESGPRSRRVPHCDAGNVKHKMCYLSYISTF